MKKNPEVKMSPLLKYRVTLVDANGGIRRQPKFFRPEGFDPSMAVWAKSFTGFYDNPKTVEVRVEEETAGNPYVFKIHHINGQVGISYAGRRKVNPSSGAKQRERGTRDFKPLPVDASLGESHEYLMRSAKYYRKHAADKGSSPSRRGFARAEHANVLHIAKELRPRLPNPSNNLVGYLEPPSNGGKERVGVKGVLTDFHHKPIGTYEITSVWKTPKSFISSIMCAVEAKINGIKYVGRSDGFGMAFGGRPAAVRNPSSGAKQRARGTRLYLGAGYRAGSAHAQLLNTAAEARGRAKQALSNNDEDEFYRESGYVHGIVDLSASHRPRLPNPADQKISLVWFQMSAKWAFVAGDPPYYGEKQNTIHDGFKLYPDRASAVAEANRQGFNVTFQGPSWSNGTGIVTRRTNNPPKGQASLFGGGEDLPLFAVRERPVAQVVQRAITAPVPKRTTTKTKGPRIIQVEIDKRVYTVTPANNVAELISGRRPSKDKLYSIRAQIQSIADEANGSLHACPEAYYMHGWGGKRWWECSKCQTRGDMWEPIHVSFEPPPKVPVRNPTPAVVKQRGSMIAIFAKELGKMGLSAHAQKAWAPMLADAAQQGMWSNALAPENPEIRRVFTKVTGIHLPNTINGSKMALYEGCFAERWQGRHLLSAPPLSYPAPRTTAKARKTKG